jgi:hypothetical protein
MSGPEMQREKERVAAKMREKQAAGMRTQPCSIIHLWNLADVFLFQLMLRRLLRRQPPGRKSKGEHTLEF